MDVVTTKYPEPDIALVTMEDRQYRNTFSHAISTGLMDAFNNLKPTTKVVVIQGYDNYFCCGGTQEELLKLCESKITFNDLAFYRLLLDCPVPTIAAMQGHARGGGLVFGCYADLIVMAEECLYSANFMLYGFTPGMGATYMLPLKLGKLLAEEMLFTGKSYHGGELKQRNIQANVVKKQEVLSTALSLARELASKPLTSLKLLKAHQTQVIRKELPVIVEQEITMHGVSFLLPEVKECIRNLFGQL